MLPIRMGTDAYPEHTGQRNWCVCWAYASETDAHAESNNSKFEKGLQTMLSKILGSFIIRCFKSSTGDIQEDWERETACWRERVGGGGGGVKSYLQYRLKITRFQVSKGYRTVSYMNFSSFSWGGLASGTVRNRRTNRICSTIFKSVKSLRRRQLT